MQDTIRIDDRFTVAQFAPDDAQLDRAAREGFRSVVNMQTEGENGKQQMKPREEGREAERLGLTYLHHPVDGEALSDAVVDAFRQGVSALPAPVFVHCASGKRSGALVMMHIGCEDGMSGDEVLGKSSELGFEFAAPQLEAFVKSYVDRHNGRR